MFGIKRFVVLFILITLGLTLFAVPEVRIKDIAIVAGIRENQLVGIGLITGLAGKGDSADSVLLRKSVANLVVNFGLHIGEEEIKSKNCAVVLVTADVPAFVQPGQKIDVTVSSIGDARGLEGGVLLQTNLRAANALVYAVAQGRITVGGSESKTVGRIADGAIMERPVVSTFVQNSRITLVLRNPDFVTAHLVAEAITAAFEGITVTALDSALIEIVIPEAQRANPVAFMAALEVLTVTPDPSNIIYINTQTKVIVVGENVRIGKVAVAYKDISVRVGAPSWGQADKETSFVIDETTSVNDFVETLKRIGIEVDVIIEIIRAIDRAGALYGRLIIV